LFSSSVVAVDANTGKYLWHFQLVHHDIWDYDTQSAPLVVDLVRNGTTVPALIVVNKTGLVFTLNRVTGKPIFDVVERPVPKSEIPGEQTSPTQPFPVKPEPLTQMTISRDNLYKGEPQHQSYCERMVDDNNIKLGRPVHADRPEPLQHFAAGAAGRREFLGRGLRSQAASVRVEHHQSVPADAPRAETDGATSMKDRSRAYAASAMPTGNCRVDRHPGANWLPSTWTRATSPIARRLALPTRFRRTFRTRAGPSTGGVILTASGLTFVGGTDDFRFRAFATATGEKLWETKLPSSIEATPLTYMGADGRQFVTVVSTGGSLTGSDVTNDEIIAFALPKR
jgi:quinoprotein glucose dehydrogenase